MKVSWYISSTKYYIIEWLVLNFYIQTVFLKVYQIELLTPVIIIFLLLEVKDIIDIIQSKKAGRFEIQRFLIGRSMVKLIFYYLVLSGLQFGILAVIMGSPDIWGREPWRYYLVILSYTGYLGFSYFTRRIVHSRSSLIREIMESFPIFHHLGLGEYFPYSYSNGSIQLNFNNMGIDELPDGWIRMVGHAEQINLSNNPISDLNISDEDVEWFRENKSEIAIIGLKTDIKLSREEIREYLPEIKILTGRGEELSEVLNDVGFRIKFLTQNLMRMEISLLADVFLHWMMGLGFYIIPQDNYEIEILKKQFHIPIDEFLEETPQDESSENESLGRDH